MFSPFKSTNVKSGASEPTATNSTFSFVAVPYTVYPIANANTAKMTVRSTRRFSFLQVNKPLSITACVCFYIRKRQIELFMLYTSISM